MKQGTRVNFKNLKTKIQDSVSNKSVVLFDVFDTIIRRRVHPEWVKDAVALWLNKQLLIRGYYFEDGFVRALRGSLEIELYDANEQIGMDREFKFQDLLEVWIQRLVGNADNALVNQVCKFEIGLEKECQVLTPGIEETLKYLKNSGKRIYFISDMYFESETIHEFLMNLGVSDYFDGGISSADCLLKKSTGRLYEHLINQLDVCSDDLLMIGDNFRSDYNNAREVGISALWISDPKELKRRTQLDATHWAANRDSFWKGKLIELILSELHEHASQDEDLKLGYLLAPMMVLFVEKIRTVAEQLSATGIYFLAREGKLFYDMYNMIRQHDETLPEAHYLYVSRKSTFLPSVSQISREGLAGVWGQYGEQTLLDIASNLSLCKELLLDVGKRYGIEHDTEVINVNEDERIVAMLEDSDLVRAFQIEKRSQYSLLEDYLKQNEFFNHRDAIVVDIGWKGTIQDNIVRAFAEVPGFPRVHGVYFGYIDIGADLGRMSSKQGFFADTRLADYVANVIFQNGSVFEMATTPDHGTTTGYSRSDDGRVTPVLRQYEKEQENFKLYFHRMFQAFTSYMDHYCKLRPFLVGNPDVQKTYFLIKIRRYLLYPSLQEATRFVQYSHVESFGVHSVTRYFFKGNPVKEMFQRPYRAAPQRLWRLIQRQIWPSGVLRRSRILGATFLYDFLSLIRTIR